MEVFKSKFLVINYDEKLNLLKEEWLNYYGIKVEDAVYQEPMLAIVKTFQEKKVANFLSDTTERKALQTKEEIWMEQNFYPELIKNGLKKIALVNSKDVLGTAVAKNIFENLNESLSVEIFNKKKNAEEWLKSN